MATNPTLPRRRDDRPADRIMCDDSLTRSLLDAAARAVGGVADDPERVPLLGRHGDLPADRRWPAVTRDAQAAAVPFDAVGGIDTEEIAEWVVGHYPADRYPAVVLGSPHGGAVHLAAALGAAWLPTSIPVTITRPGGSAGDWPAAMRWGAALAGRIVAGNPWVTVRQVHDPVRYGPLCGVTVRLHLRWRVLPAAYRSFLRSRLAPGGASLLLRDLRTWPVLAAAPGYGFQVGSPVSGLAPEDLVADAPAFRRVLDGLGVTHWLRPPVDAPPRYAERSGEQSLGQELRRVAAETGGAAHRVLYARPEMVSACVADLYRHWFGGQRCVVESGRLLDPARALAGGLVPYWCESASRTAADAAQLWLAGSPPYEEVTVLPEAPGQAGGGFASLADWRAVASFGRSRGAIDLAAARRYPMLPMPAGHAGRVLAEAGRPPAAPPPATVRSVLDFLQRTGAPLGMLVS